jgi:hypothetical protein
MNQPGKDPWEDIPQPPLMDTDPWEDYLETLPPPPPGPTKILWDQFDDVNPWLEPLGFWIAVIALAIILFIGVMLWLLIAFMCGKLLGLKVVAQQVLVVVMTPGGKAKLIAAYGAYQHLKEVRERQVAALPPRLPLRARLQAFTARVRGGWQAIYQEVLAPFGRWVKSWTIPIYQKVLAPTGRWFKKSSVTIYQKVLAPTGRWFRRTFTAANAKKIWHRGLRKLKAAIWYLKRPPRNP